MSVDEVSLLLALLSVAVLALACTIAVLALVAARSERVGRWWTEMRQEHGTTALLAAAIVAVGATAGSLYLSEVAHLPPCRLCWYQRIAAYPLGPLLLLAWARRDRGIRPYAVLLAVAGASISTYHVLLERFPSLEAGACEIENPCTVRWIERFGFLTIPAMAWCAFVAVLALSFFVPPPERGRPR